MDKYLRDYDTLYQRTQKLTPKVRPAYALQLCVIWSRRWPRRSRRHAIVTPRATRLASSAPKLGHDRRATHTTVLIALMSTQSKSRRTSSSTSRVLTQRRTEFQLDVDRGDGVLAMQLRRWRV